MCQKIRKVPLYYVLKLSSHHLSVLIIRSVPRQRSSGGAMQFFEGDFASSDFAEPTTDKEECQNLFRACNHL